MKFYQHRTVEEQANRLPSALREAYRNSQIDRITISAGGETVELTGYAEYSYLEEKSYKTQPVRTIDGKIEELDEYATFLTPRLIIKYNMMGIDDYRATMRLLKKYNAFMVTCYDVVGDKITTQEMYVAPTSMPIIYQQYLIALGIQEFTIELIGTNTTSPSDDGGSDTVDLGEITITSNGTYTANEDALDGYSVVYVNVPTGGSGSGSSPVLTNLNVTKNGKYIAGEDGYDGYSEVDVNVEPILQQKTATSNGTITPDYGYDGLSKVIVNVSGGTTIEEYDGTITIV